MRSNSLRIQPAVPDKPIFLDETGQRWRLLRAVLLGSATGLLMLPVILALSIMKVEVLPERSGELQQRVIAASPSGYWTRPGGLKWLRRWQIRAQRQ